MEQRQQDDANGARFNEGFSLFSKVHGHLFDIPEIL
jgi:hypothetical protein